MAINYTKGMLHQKYAQRVLTGAAKEILQEQREAVRIYYNRRSGKIMQDLSDAIASVRPTAGGTTLFFKYLIDLRFLDMKKTASGKKKKVYGPVYNRILWGHVYGNIIPQLRFGLNRSIEVEIIDELKESYNQFTNGN